MKCNNPAVYIITSKICCIQRTKSQTDHLTLSPHRFSAGVTYQIASPIFVIPDFIERKKDGKTCLSLGRAFLISTSSLWKEEEEEVAMKTNFMEQYEAAVFVYIYVGGTGGRRQQKPMVIEILF